MNDKKTFVIDIDGTICTQVGDDYTLAVPKKDRIEAINRLHDNDHTIIYFTARGMGRNKNNVSDSVDQFYDLTWHQLKQWDCKFDKLILGKPSGDFYVDDKAVNDSDFFNYLVRNFQK